MLITTVLRGIEYLHEHHVVHRGESTDSLRIWDRSIRSQNSPYNLVCIMRICFLSIVYVRFETREFTIQGPNA